MSQKPAATFTIGDLNFKVFDDWGYWYVECNDDGEHKLNSTFYVLDDPIADIKQYYEKHLA